MRRNKKLKTFTFYLDNGLSFKVKAESITTTTDFTGKIIGYEIKSLKNFVEVNINKVIAIVEDLTEE